MTRFILQQKEDPHGDQISLYVGNLPTGLSQRQYEKILLDVIGKGEGGVFVYFFKNFLQNFVYVGKQFWYRCTNHVVIVTTIIEKFMNSFCIVYPLWKNVLVLWLDHVRTIKK